MNFGFSAVLRYSAITGWTVEFFNGNNVDATVQIFGFSGGGAPSVAGIISWFGFVGGGGPDFDIPVSGEITFDIGFTGLVQCGSAQCPTPPVGTPCCLQQPGRRCAFPTVPQATLLLFEYVATIRGVRTIDGFVTRDQAVIVPQTVLLANTEPCVGASVTNQRIGRSTCFINGSPVDQDVLLSTSIRADLGQASMSVLLSGGASGPCQLWLGQRFNAFYLTPSSPTLSYSFTDGTGAGTTCGSGGQPNNTTCSLTANQCADDVSFSLMRTQTNAGIVTTTTVQGFITLLPTTAPCTAPAGLADTGRIIIPEPPTVASLSGGCSSCGQDGGAPLRGRIL